VKPLRVYLIAVALLAGCTRGPEPRMIGSKAPDFTITDSDRTVSLHDLHGKIIVLNFWTSWCPPCIDEMPSLVRMQKLMAPKVAVLAVSTDKNERDYHNFLVQHQIDLLTVRDEAAKSSHLYGTTGQPETFIIDANGIVRRKFVGPEDWTSPEMIEYFNKL
jgi:cytochrome c biogenesis protein CcmG, thiol:disulfide interchange protein DsbE